MHPRVYLWKLQSLGRARGYRSGWCPVTNRTRYLVAFGSPPASFDPPHHRNISPLEQSTTHDGARAALAGDPDTHHQRPLATLPNTRRTEARGEGGLGKEKRLAALSHARHRLRVPRMGGAAKWVPLMPRERMPLLMASRHLSLAGVARLTA